MAEYLLEQRHTPAPWSLNAWPRSDSHLAVGAIGTPLVALLPLRDVSINEQKANARLVAASPKLLDALRWLLREAESRMDAEHNQEVFAAARAAIAQATGEGGDDAQNAD